MQRSSLLNRLLTTTAVLSVVLGSMPPLPLLAQETVPVPPAEQPVQDEAPAQTNDSETPAEANEAEPVPTEEPAVPSEPPPEPVPDQPPEAADPAPEAAPAEPAEPAPTETAPAEAAPVEPAPMDTAPPEPAPSEPAPADPAPEAAPADPAPTETAPAEPEPSEVPPVEAAPQNSAPAPAADPTPAPEAEAAPEASQSEPAATEPSGEAVDVLNSLLGGGAATGAAAAAGEDAEPEGEATTTTITEQDARSSSEDFSTTASGERRNDDDDDGGLSNLQKVGLLALGGLAVGALLNNGDEVVSNTGDRVVVRQSDGQYSVLKDDDTLLRQPGSTVRTENFTDGSTRSTVEYDDGSRVVTIRDATGRVLRRSRLDASGAEVRLIDDTTQVAPVDISQLPPARDEVRISASDRGSLRDALARIESRDNARAYSLSQIRDYRQVRALAPVVDVQNITFRTGSAAVDATQAEQLSDLGTLLTDLIADNPREVFLIEGHTDAVGSSASNLALSDRRAESVALALTEYFDVPPENLVVQGYGESDLRVETEGNEPRNRRVAVRIITPILQTAQAR